MKPIKQKIEKELPEFSEEVNTLSIEQLNNRLSDLAKDYEEVEDSKENDEELIKARENAKLLNAPYVDAKKAIRLKNRYIIALLKEKGGL